MKIVMKDDRTFQGTPLQIVQAMQAISFGVEPQTVRRYIASIVEDAQRFEGISMAVSGSTDGELAASLIDEMLRAGLARRG